MSDALRAAIEALEKATEGSERLDVLICAAIHSDELRWYTRSLDAAQEAAANIAKDRAEYAQRHMVVGISDLYIVELEIRAMKPEGE